MHGNKNRQTENMTSPLLICFMHFNLMRKMLNTKGISNATICAGVIFFSILQAFGNEINLRVIWKIPKRQQIMKSRLYKVVQIWLGRFVCKQVTVCPGHILTTLYICIISTVLCKTSLNLAKKLKHRISLSALSWYKKCDFYLASVFSALMKQMNKSCHHPCTSQSTPHTIKSRPSVPHIRSGSLWAMRQC
jgi:hypothetical protein